MNDDNTIHKLVIDFQHDDKHQQKLLFTHVKNILRDFEPGALQIEIVTYGPAIKMMLRENIDHTDTIQKLAQRGIIFSVCNNAMKLFDISEDQLMDVAQVVPSGLGKIVKAQVDGYNYLKA